MRCTGLLAFCAVGIVAACGGSESLPTLQHAPQRADGARPGPAPRGRSADEAVAANRACEGCHRAIATEWRASFHARSHTDAAYQRAFAIEPLAFCQACHAPEANPNEPVPAAAAEMGVGCVTCHVVGTDVLAAPGAMRGQSAPHPILRDARLSGTAACASCHEFEFPDRGARSRPELMQATLSEHRKSAQSASACAECHMPKMSERGVVHRSHAFAGGHDAELVQSAIAVSAERTATGARITLAPGQLGHAFPTGDLFRRLEVSAEAVGPEWQVVASKTRYLARHWQRQPSPFGVVLRSASSDDRPLAEPAVVELELGAAAAALPIHWRVMYQRVEHPRSEREHDASVEGEIEIESGALENEP